MIFNVFLHKNIISKIIFDEKKLKMFQNNVVDYSLLHVFNLINYFFFLTVYDYIKILDIFYSKVISYTYEARDVFIPYLFLHLFIYIILVV